MIVVSIKPNGSGIQFDNLVGKLRKDEDHRAIVHSMLRANRGKEGEEAKTLIEERMQMRGLDVGVKIHGVKYLMDRWCESTLEVWVKQFTIRKLLEEITLGDLKAALEQYEEEEQAFVTIETSQIYDGFPDVRRIEDTLQQLLSSNGHGAVKPKTRRAFWEPGCQWTTIRLQPEGQPVLNMS